MPYLRQRSSSARACNAGWALHGWPPVPDLEPSLDSATVTSCTVKMSLSSLLVAVVVVGAARGTLATPPKTIMSIFIDDLGFYDTQVVIL